eukprot:10079600-Karenia_brevis.AAC.1
MDLEIVDLVTNRHKVLNRDSAFPAEHLGEIYAFDPVSRADLNDAKRRAVLQARVLADDEELAVVGRAV